MSDYVLMDYEALHEVIFGKSNTFKHSVMLWFELNGEQSYDHYLTECKRFKKRAQGKYETPVSQLKKLIQILTKIENLKENDKTSFFVFDTKSEF